MAVAEDGVAIDGAEVAAEAGADTRAMERESAAFARILAERSAVAVPTAREFRLTAAQRADIDAPIGDDAVPKVGAAIDIAQPVDFSGIDARRLPAGGLALPFGIVGETAHGTVVWEMALVSAGASGLRLQFTDLDLAPGVELYVYNEDGQVWGPYVGKGPDGDGGLWSPSTFGDVVRIHVRATDASALAASRFTLAGLMHLGARVAPLQDIIRARYAVGPVPQNMDYCGVSLEDCTQNAMCWISSNAYLAKPAQAIAHLQFVRDGGSYICTGAYLSQTGNAPQQPYFMTANHCFSTQASASSLEAYFRFNSGSCPGTCPTRSTVPRVNGATLIATGAAPGAPDYTFLRLSGFPSSGAWLLGWDSGLPAEGASLMHMGHPKGAPLTFAYRRIRYNNSSVPRSSGVPEPTFIYSALASSSSDWTGATEGGSSGGPAMVLASDGIARFVGQLYGKTHAGTTPDACNPNTTATVDGALRSSFPTIRRYLHDRIFGSGFERP